MALYCKLTTGIDPVADALRGIQVPEDNQGLGNDPPILVNDADLLTDVEE